MDISPERLRPVLSLIADFYTAEGRPLPWRADREPYHVWLSEIMLQQTRVEAVIPYYERFLRVFPTVEALAAADDDTLYKCWEGLGYYARARNLRRAAQTVAALGCFPSDYEGLVSLSGVGEYTAGAIGSICFGLPTPAVDGNVLRVLARLFAITEDITSPAVKKAAREALTEAYPTGERACAVTQGFMEIGQRFCLPNGTPKCEGCPLRAHCQVGLEGGHEHIPVRAAKKARKIQKRTLLLLLSEGEDGPRFALRKRPERGLLAGLWEFPSVEGHLADTEAFALAKKLGFDPMGAVASVSATHTFTHLEWHMESYLVPIKDTLPKGYTLVTPAEMETVFPIASAFRAFKDFVKKNKM